MTKIKAVWIINIFSFNKSHTSLIYTDYTVITLEHIIIVIITTTIIKKSISGMVGGVWWELGVWWWVVCGMWCVVCGVW